MRPAQIAVKTSTSPGPPRRNATHRCMRTGVSRHHRQNRREFSESSSSRSDLPSTVSRSVASAMQARASPCADANAQHVAARLLRGSGDAEDEPAGSDATSRSRLRREAADLGEAQLGGVDEGEGHRERVTRI